MITPTPGRIVWYRAGTGDVAPSHGDAPLAALVAGVINDTTVNLSVFGADGSGPHPKQNVVLVQEGEPQPGQACWMPFQKGQAAAASAAPAPDGSAVIASIAAKGTEIHNFLDAIEARVKDYFEQGHTKLMAAAAHVESVVEKAHATPAPAQEPPQAAPPLQPAAAPDPAPASTAPAEQPA